MQRGRTGLGLASALLALMITAPTVARAQEQVVVPIPPLFYDQPVVRHNDARAPQPAAPAVIVPVPKAAATAPALASTPKPETAATAPQPSNKEQRSVRQDVPLPRLSPSALAPAQKTASAVPLPPVNAKRAAVHHDAVPLPRSAPRSENRPAAEPLPDSRTDATSPQPADDAADRNVAAEQSLSGPDAPIADKLREIVTAKWFARRVAHAPDRHAIEAFYGARHYAPLWIHDGQLTARAKAVIARLKDAADDGLEASAYPVPRFAAETAPAALASDEVKLTRSVLSFARHLAVGRIAPGRVFEQVDYGNHTPDPTDILKTITDAGDVNAAFDSFNPPHQGFRALKRKLAELRAHTSGGAAHARIPDGRPIRPGRKDERVPMLRERLGLKSKRHGTTYDHALVRAVQALQRRHNITPSGIVGPKTLAVLNAPKTSQVIDRVLANMERWRWLPRNLGSTYVMVNIPDYTLEVVHRHRLVWRTKIVAGKPATPTPLATATMDSVIVNPSWHVPQSIIENELLPRYQYDPNIFDRMGLEVKRGRDGNISVVQPPGAANALGRIKFNFPNKFQVYLHDTPAKRLFKYKRRAFSHGCMRVQDPTKFGEVILRLAMNRPSPNARQLRAMFGSDEHVFKLTERPMVHLTYQTAFVDNAGKLHLRDDVYGFDARIIDLMHGSERRTADIAPPPDSKRELTTFRGNQEMLRQVERRAALNPFGVFEEIFR